MKTWPIFIPLFGFIYFIVMCFKDKTEYSYWNVRNDDKWQFGGPLSDWLMLLYVWYALCIHVPSTVFIGFLLLGQIHL